VTQTAPDLAPAQLHAPAPAVRSPLVLTPTKRWLELELGELWRFRELLFFLSWRDVKVRYKQTALGAAWAVIQPLLTMVAFTAIFGTIAKLPSEGVPYPVFTFTALLPWQLFSFALTNSSNSLVGNQSLVSKVYFPRLVVPIASMLPGLVDFFISLGVLVVMMVAYHVPIGPRALVILPLLGLTTFSALAVGLWLSALNVQYRDVRYIVPFLTTFWQYATPIGYSQTLVPERWRLLYSLNPMTGVVTGFRWALLGTGQLDASVWMSVAIIGALLVSGLLYFKRMEHTFADVI
jgi:lipopolysaccharide transport system permease protein